MNEKATDVLTTAKPTRKRHQGQDVLEAYLRSEDNGLEPVLGVVHLLLGAHVQQVGQDLRILQPKIME